MGVFSLLGFNKTATLYTPYNELDENGDIKAIKWHRLVLENVSLSIKRKVIVTDGATAEQHTDVIKVKKRADYVEPYMFNGNGFTLKQGAIVIKGIVEDVISDNSSGNDLLEKYKERAFTLATAKDNTLLTATAHYRGES